MNRYIAQQSIQDTDTRKRRLQTGFLKVPDSGPGDFYIKTTSIERLDKLAYNFYNDETTWPIIAIANAIPRGTLIVPANTLLRIPDPELVSQNINTILNNR